jgi:two-component system sensor histidine kinase/response regulator
MPPTKLSGPLRVLVVEDNAINQRLVVTFLEDAGHTPVLAASGREALTALKRESFDLILMDVQMPDMDGFQTTAAIRAWEGSTRSRIPILATTANAHREDRERCLAAGMDGYLAKPIRYEELIALVESSAGREREPRPAPSPNNGPNSGIVQRPGLRKEMIPLFLDDSLRLQAEMREAIARRDAVALERAAHTLRGTAGFFVAQTVFDLARCLENLAKAGDFGPEADGACQQLADELARLARMPLPE